MPSSSPVFSTPLTRLFGITHPVMLAGMNVAAGPRLAAAVTNAGGIGVIGGLRQTPKILQQNIEELKSHLEDKNAPFGVDLLLPQVGGTARKTNYDYTNGQLDELLDAIIRCKAALFVSAVVAVDKLHAAGIPVMKYDMIGHPKHVSKALAKVWTVQSGGVDIICAQGGEGGGHTGEIPFSILIPAVVDLCKDARSPPIIVVAAGGIGDGRGLAAALSYGAAGVWVGTRFVASEEAGAPPKHKDLLAYDDVIRTLVYSGRPMSVHKTPYKHPEKSVEGRMWLMGRVAGSINVLSNEIVNSAAASLRNASRLIVREAKL
ncbi:2-nitropropane dioxygenase [Pisolithus tinctorius]|nr:2-nitropropane dioxygenase [Pisolithus tinctorius]